MFKLLMDFVVFSGKINKYILLKIFIMDKKAKIKISYSKSAGEEEVEVDIIHFFTPPKQERRVKCNVSSATSDDVQWISDSYEINDDSISPDAIDINLEEIEQRILQTRDDFPEYAIEKNRLRTFYEWPKAMKQTPQQLSEAGFFYTGKADRVICFSCGGGLRAWEDQDDPWEEHALHYDRCDYLQSLKGSEYIASVKEKSQTSKEDSEIPNLSFLFGQN